MADSGGHWQNLAAAQKLTQSMRIPGVFEEDIKRNLEEIERAKLHRDTLEKRLEKAGGEAGALGDGA